MSQIPSTICVGPPPPANGKYITILTIDGGGIRGIIPGVILEYLESQLQMLDGPEARLADYFDVIAGTSTGGLVTAMLTAPNNNNKPLFAAKDIVPFYHDNCPKIFKQSGWWWPIAKAQKWWKELTGPRYDGKYLKELVEEKLGAKKLNQTLTKVVIPTFDIKYMQPVIFSSYEVSAQSSSKNAKLSDICLGTSAAPTYLPAHQFTNYYDEQKYREYNLIDGGIVANNPSRSSLSGGTGMQKREPRFDAKMAANWGMIGWIDKDGASPLIDSFTEASSDLVDFEEGAIFADAHAAENYLRIQWFFISAIADLLSTCIVIFSSCDCVSLPNSLFSHNACVAAAVAAMNSDSHDDSATIVSFLLLDVNSVASVAESMYQVSSVMSLEELASVDLATPENLKNLENVGKVLLDKHVTRANSDTGVVEMVQGGGTNRAALDRFAKKLSDEQKLRKLNYYGGSA
ncbi:patatin-like protein 2 [Tanacetum coccineum]